MPFNRLFVKFNQDGATGGSRKITYAGHPKLGWHREIPEILLLEAGKQGLRGERRLLRKTIAYKPLYPASRGLYLCGMKMFQQVLDLPEKRRGFHLITSEVVRAMPDLSRLKSGMCQVFIQHTSASLTINENADPTVRKDFETWFNKTVKENDPDYLHDDEGPDDMPAHIKSSLLGCAVLFPVYGGRLAFGTWQGIYLCEHRNQGGSRRLFITAWGEPM